MEVIVGFCVGFIFALVMSVIFKEDGSVNKIQLQEYYCALMEAKFYKQKYDDLHSLLEDLDESDVTLCDKEHYNHFIIKKKHISEDFLSKLFDD